MISNKMRERLAHKSAIRDAFDHACRLKKEYGESNVFDFSIGNPCASCPQGVVDAIDASAVSDSKVHGYMDSVGYEDVRETIANSLNERFEGSYTKQSIVMTSGCSGGINMILMSLLDPADEVITFLPSFPAYAGYIDLWDAKNVEVDYEVQDGRMLPCIEDFKTKLSEKTKVVIVNTPNNPSGDVYPSETVKQICEELKLAEQRYGHSIYLLSDEPYRELVWDDDNLAIERFEKNYQNTIVAYSFSKSASVAGERVGYNAINPDCDGFEELFCAMKASVGCLGFVNPSATAQRIASFCVDDVADLSLYKKNRDVLKENLSRFGYQLNPGDGAFYLLLSAKGKSEEELLDALLQCNVVAVAGSVFGCPDHLRLSYCLDEETIRKSIPAFEKAAKTLNL